MLFEQYGQSSKVDSQNQRQTSVFISLLAIESKKVINKIVLLYADTKNLPLLKMV